MKFYVYEYPIRDRIYGEKRNEKTGVLEKVSWVLSYNGSYTIKEGVERLHYKGEKLVDVFEEL